MPHRVGCASVLARGMLWFPLDSTLSGVWFGTCTANYCYPQESELAKPTPGLDQRMLQHCTVNVVGVIYGMLPRR